MKKIFGLERKIKMKEPEYYKMLIANLPNDVIEMNVELLANDHNYSNESFVQKGDKCLWDVEALIIERRGYPYVADVLPALFMWLQDMNWPGADIIERFLRTLPRNVFVENLEKATKQAVLENDVCWLYWLRELTIDLDLKKEEFRNGALYEVLKHSTDM